MLHVSNFNKRRYAIRQHILPALSRYLSSSNVIHRGLGAKMKPKAKMQKQQDSHEVDDKEELDATRNMIEKSRSSNSEATYHDPANSSLDLTLSNKQLYTSIIDSANKRMFERYQSPSDEWLRRHLDSIDHPISKSSKSTSEIEEEFSNCIKNAKVSLRNSNKDIEIGDLILFNEDNPNFYLLVGLPSELGSLLYTFISKDGEIIHAPRHAIKIRFPVTIPDYLIAIAKNLVVLEKKKLDIAPVGLPDGKFSRSIESLPIELQKLKSNSLDQSSTEENLSSNESGDDFIISQASSQLLVNSNVNTYIVPISARNFFSKSLTQLSIKIFDKLPEIQTKLKILHNLLQYDENGDLLESPRTLSIFEILRNLECIPITKSSDSMNYDLIRENMKYSHAETSSLGKTTPDKSSWNHFGFKEYTISTFCALILSLRMQGRSWKVSQKPSSKFPTTVDILPSSKVKSLEMTINHLRYHNGIPIFVKTLKKNLKNNGENINSPYYKETIQLLKDYIISNFTNDPVTETIVVKIIRSIDEELVKENLINKPITSHSYEYSKNRALDILNLFKNDDASIRDFENPSSWSYSLQLPNNNTSIMSDLSQDYYNCLDKRFQQHSTLESNLSDPNESFPIVINQFNDELKSQNSSKILYDFYNEDPFKSIRSDFDDVPIYCIDSPTAHEIDDGLSIQLDGDKYVFSIHIANPTSYIKPNSILSKIAFSKGSTYYLPEGASMMFPKLVSQIAGLGENIQGSRTMAFQYKIDKKLFDEYIKSKNDDINFKPSIKFSQTILEQMESTSNVSLFMASNFPKGFTYEKVNEMLNNDINQENFKQLKIDDIHSDNIFKLYYMANIIKDIRIMNGTGIDIDSESTNVEVNRVKDSNLTESLKLIKNGYELSKPNQDSSITKIKITRNGNQNFSSKSQLLVSQLMISGNYTSSVFAQRNNIKIIHRSQDMNINKIVADKIKEISQKRYKLNESLTLEEKSQIISIFTGATLQVNPKIHNSIGLKSYSTVTSPLRRFVDLINHQKLENHLLRQQTNEIEELEDDEYKLDFISSYLQSRELICKTNEKISIKYWKGFLLNEYFRLYNQGKIESPIEFKFLIRSSPKFGDISANLINFEEFNTKIEVNSKLIEEFNEGKFKVGSILTGDFKILKLDYIENEIVFQYN